MIILYLDNYRGFSESFIEIKDINFLVGENSTGKTSFLYLLNLFSRAQFWFNQEFNYPDIQLGYFDDIVNKFSHDRKYFTIGYIKILKNTINAIVLKYIKKDINPQIQELRYISGNTDIQIIIRKNTIYYKSTKFDKKQLDQNATNFYKKWIAEFNYINEENAFNEFKEIKIKRRPDSYAFFIIKSLIESEISGDKFDISSMDIPILFNNFSWIAPIRTKPKTIYEGFKISFSPEGEHVPFLLKNILDERKKVKFHEILKFIREFGDESGLFQSLLVKKYGKSKTSPFELNIMLNDLIFKISNVGYGVSQVLPVLIDSISLSRGSRIAIQQPEIHLHPRAQASLGELIYNLYHLEDKKFLIETHSDYLIDRFRICQNKGEYESDAQVLFFERDNRGNRANQIFIEKDGNYSEDQPDNFRDFFIKEQLSILEI